MNESAQISHEDHKLNSENRSPSKLIDRFYKRLDAYRLHQNECKLRDDQTTNRVCELQSNSIIELQRKSKEVKQKRASKRGLKRTHQNEKNHFQQVAPRSENLDKIQFKNNAFVNLNGIPETSTGIFPPNFEVKQEPVETLQNQYYPSNDLDDLDFRGMETLLTQPFGPEILNFEENLAQATTVIGQSYQLFQQRQFQQFDNYRGIYFNPNWIP